MDAGTYDTGTMNYPMLTAGGTLTSDTVTVQWNTQPDSTVQDNESADGQSLVQRSIPTPAIATDSLTTAVDQLSVKD